MLPILLSLVALAAAAPSGLINVQKFNGPTKPNGYLVKLKSGATTSSFIQSSRVSGVTYSDWRADVFNGFAGVFNDTQLAALRANGDVEAIYEDGIVQLQTTQTNAPWGISRLSNGVNPVIGSASALNYSFSYPTNATGFGVDIYMLDTGLNVWHEDLFTHSQWGWIAPGLAGNDDNGHGTHVAGIAGGVRYGVAKRALLIAVKVLDSAGAGTVSNVVGGFNYVAGAAPATGKPSIVSVSLGGGVSEAIDSAVTALVNAGIHVVVAAGNSNADAANTSPARTPGAITVGATTIADAKASYSNYGSVLDIWAPGSDITSSYTGGPSASYAVSLSGTSMAAPHVAGAAAVYLSYLGKNIPPAQLLAQLPSVYNVVSGVPSGTINRLIQVPVAEVGLS